MPNKRDLGYSYNFHVTVQQVVPRVTFLPGMLFILLFVLDVKYHSVDSILLALEAYYFYSKEILVNLMNLPLI